MPLLSELLKNDTRLEDCLNKPLAHIKFKTPPEVGPHVEKIHQALATLNPDGPEIPDSGNTHFDVRTEDCRRSEGL